MGKLSTRFTLILLQITVLIAYVSASNALGHGGRLMRRHTRLGHNLRADMIPNEAPSCPKRNHFKKLREAAALAGSNGQYGTNGTTTAASGAIDTNSTVLSSPVLTSTSSASQAEATSSSLSTTKSSSSGSSTTSTTSSSSHPSQPTGAPSSGGRLGNLFPVGYSKSWTTCPKADNPLHLGDDTLQPFSVLRTTLHSYEKAPDGRNAMKAHYPQGSYTFTHSPLGGFSFYTHGHSSVKLADAKEATFGYAVYFPNGFAFNKGGKLPGFYGGDNDDEATNCSGGRRSDACFSARLMWRTDGVQENCTPTFPQTSLQTKRFAASSPSPNAMIRQSNGELELWVNGKSVISVKGLVLRVRNAGRLRGIQFQTFFGGLLSQNIAPYAKSVVGVDISQGMVDLYNMFALNQGLLSEELRAVRFDVLASSPQDPFNGQRFDVVVCASAYHHFESIEDVTTALVSYLKPGGTLIVVDLIQPGDQVNLDELFPEHEGSIVAHRGGFKETTIVQAFEKSGLQQVGFRPAVNVKKKGQSLQLFLAKGRKPSL
ncbi:hypothetical protein D9611_004093 [Ephemerocybe angulata]|uniref:Methyltransferase type 11 domain-containing protein n=1 Tax=Ephemerocybe angulata TaxID=980116 RepID=A0A8H5BJZ3_9AGAR|nr:hypothetical protein D9611_004093 [Tulosesus angulatus]